MRVLIPDAGKPPERCDRFQLEGRRLLHVALRDAREKQPALAAALASIAEEYDELDWQKCGEAFPSRLIDKVRSFRPTVIWMQLQRATTIGPETIDAIRQSVPGCKIIQWDGDQHHEPEDPRRHWFVELGRAIDCSLVVNTRYPARYSELGVRNCGYLQIGVDREIYKPTPPGFHRHEILFLGSWYGTHSARNEIINSLAGDRRIRPRMGIYGHGWSSSDGFLFQRQEAAAYGAAKCAISMSITDDLPRYTSDRLFRGLCSGGVMLVERFPECEALGLVDGLNCILWHGESELRQAINRACAMTGSESQHMRDAAVELGHRRHTWKARMHELEHILRQL